MRVIASPGEREAAMKLESLFRPGVFSVEADETLADAASKMQFEEIGSLAVLQKGHFAGIITERDLVRAIADGVEPATIPVARYTTEDPIVASPEDGTQEAAARMVVLGVRHLPLVACGELVGMISIRDLLEEAALAKG
jgi:CBS domain-containing protein